MNLRPFPVPKKPIPGPQGRVLLADLKAMQENPLKLISSSFNRYGDFIYYPFGLMKTYIISHPEAIQHILQRNHRNYVKNTFQYNLLAGITGKGLLTNEGDSWLRQRRLIQPAFHRASIAAFDSLITSAVRRMLDRWEKYALSEAIVDVDSEMMQLALEIVAKALFGSDLSDRSNDLTTATLTVLDDIVHRARHPFSPPTWFPTPRNREFQSALKLLDQVVYDLIGSRREALQSPGRDNYSTSIDLLDLLLMARDEQTGSRMDDRQLRDEMITLLIAGHETVASAMTWTWFLISQNPDQEAKLHTELDRVLQGRIPNSQDLAHLPFTRMVFEEALRLYPPAWMITRRAVEVDNLPHFPDYPIPAGALVIISPYLVHRHPDFWEEPEKFIPDRFLPERSLNRPRFAYIPFGGGPRMCIGDGFALLEAQLVIASIAQRFRLSIRGTVPVEFAPLVTLRPVNGLPMAIQTRG